MISDAADAGVTADLLAMLDADPHGWALARAVREDGEIVDFDLMYVNRAGSRFLGRPPDELVGRSYRRLWPETMTDDTLPMYRQVVQERVAMVRTVFYDRASIAGHFEFRIGPYSDGFLARFVDLAKLTVGPQSEGGARLYEALDAAFDGFTLLRAVRDEAGTITDFTCEYVNEVGAKLAGRAAEDLIGRPVSEVSPGSTEYGLFDRYRQAAEGGGPSRQRFTAPATGLVWEVKIVRVDTDFVAVSYREITDQVSQQERLARAADEARAAADRTSHLQSVTVALQSATEAFVAANTPDEVYAAMDQVMRPAAGGHGLAVLLVDPDRLERDRLVLTHHAGYEPEVVEQLRQLPLTHQYPAAEVTVTGQPRYLSSPAQFAAAQPDARTAVSGGSRQAWAFLPLVTAGQTLGAVVIGYHHPRDFAADDRATLVTFSRLAAQALQRALLFQAQLSIAADLQRALLPAVLPPLNGAQHAVRYLPWTQGVDVGGDWYDVINLGPDTAAVVIGDVVGHSIQAAATMGQLRNALRAYAADGHSPTGIMQRTNQLLLGLEPEAVATCCYLELHLAEGTATAVLAGHPPPILRTAQGADVLTLRAGPPLGVDSDARYLDTTFLLPSGSSLLLYTDGLVEDRRYSIDRGLAALRAAISSAPATDPEALLQHILTADVGPHPRSDDVAILALTTDDRPAPAVLTAQRRLRGEAVSAAAARRFAADILAAWNQHHLIDDACLLLDEVVTNAVQHTVGDIVVRIELTDRLRVEVHDSSQRGPDKRPMDAHSEIGRGLHVIDVLAREWGHNPLPTAGKTVWFELDTDGSEPTATTTR